MANEYFVNEDELLAIDEDVSKYVPQIEGLRRGDLITFTENGQDYREYRNSGVHIWDGEHVLPLDCSVDDYGSVPNVFKVGIDFRPDHWIDKIEHNEIVYLDERLIDSIKFKSDESVGTVEMFNKSYTIEFHYDSWCNKTFTTAELIRLLKEVNPPFDSGRDALVCQVCREYWDKLYPED